MQTLAERLRHVRGRMTQKDFSKKINVSQSSYSLYEQGQRTPDADTLNRICDFFGIDPGWLLTGRGEVSDGAQKSPTVGGFGDGKNSQHIEKKEIKKIHPPTSAAGSSNSGEKAGDAASHEAELASVLRENTSLHRELLETVRQNGDLRVETERLRMDIERRDARIAELERQLAEALKPCVRQTLLDQRGAAAG